MGLLTFRDSFDNSFDNILNGNILDDDIIDNKTFILLSVNLSLFAQLKDLDIESIITFNAIQSSTSLKLDINKFQPYVR